MALWAPGYSSLTTEVPAIPKALTRVSVVAPDQSWAYHA